MREIGISIKPGTVSLGVCFQRVTSLDMPKIAFKIVAGVLGALLLMAVLEILFAPISIAGNFAQKSKLQRQLVKAQQLWDSNGSESYKIKVRGAEPMLCLYAAVITVQRGQIVTVESREALVETSEYQVVPKEKWNNPFGCDYTQFTISQVFAAVHGALENTDPLTQRPEITFDTENGYVTHYQINYYREGLLTAVQISDCCSWYEFSDYEPLK